MVVLTEAWGCNHMIFLLLVMRFCSLNQIKRSILKVGDHQVVLSLYTKTFWKPKLTLFKQTNITCGYITCGLSWKQKQKICLMKANLFTYVLHMYLQLIRNTILMKFLVILKKTTFYSRNGDCIILVSDFNARTSNKPDFIDTAMNDKSFEIIDAPQDVQSVSINTGRNNYDSHSNKHGDSILDICKTCNLRIRNDKKSGDTW